MKFKNKNEYKKNHLLTLKIKRKKLSKNKSLVKHEIQKKKANTK